MASGDSIGRGQAALDRDSEKVARLRRPNGSAPWTADLAPASGGGFIGNEHNVLLAMRAAPALQGLVRFNEFALDVEFTRSPPWRSAAEGDSWTEVDDTYAAAWLQAQGLKLRGKGTVADCVQVVARDLPHHPVRAYLEALKWDERWRLATWLRDYLGATGSAEYLGAIGRRFLISAVARILRPGCQADHVLVLEGAQGIGKTSVARALAVHQDWFAGNLPDIHGKDAPLQLAGRWIIEIAELKAVRASQLDAVKSFLSETADTFRPPYARRSAQFPRQCVFLGTTNETEYLRDRTGNRRFWPVRATGIDLPRLVRDRDQLWAEAVAAYQAGEQWHLTPAETAAALEEQAERVPESELEASVAEYLGQLTSSEVTVRDVLTFGLGLDPADSSYQERARRMGTEVADAIVRCGWVKVGRCGRRPRTVYRHVDKGRQGI